MDREHYDGLLRTWQQYAAELTLQQLQSEPSAVLHHLQSFPQYVVERGLEATKIAQCADMHERIASFLPVPQPPASAFYTSVMRDVSLLQDKIIKTYVVSKIADKIHSMALASGLPCQIWLNGAADPMLTWIREVQSELEPLQCVDFAWRFGGKVNGIIHLWSFCGGGSYGRLFNDVAHDTEKLLDLLRILGYQATTSRCEMLHLQ